MAGVYRIYPKQRRNFFGNLSATKLIIFANVIFFIIAVILLQFLPNFFNYIALNPTNIFQGKYLWTFLTSMFMHAPGVIPFLSFHLLINMFVLF